MARIIADRLGTVLGQSIVIENKGGGAGGSIGAKFVAAADPDGYTILITPGGSLTTGPAVHKNIGYDPVKVFVPVAQLIETPLVVSVHPSLPVKTMAELVTYAKANPGKVSWGSQGFGVAPHLLLELFKLETGVNVVHVPYRGTAPMLTAVLAGEVQVVADPMTTSLSHIEAGKLRAIAIAGAERTPKLPNVPTVVEAGFPKLQSPFWLGVVAPAGTPQRHHRQAQHRVPRKPQAARRRARCWPSSAPISRSARRPSLRQHARQRARAVDRRGARTPRSRWSETHHECPTRHSCGGISLTPLPVRC